jgi:hypothetical protein
MLLLGWTDCDGRKEQVFCRVPEYSLESDIDNTKHSGLTDADNGNKHT